MRKFSQEKGCPRLQFAMTMVQSKPILETSETNGRESGTKWGRRAGILPGDSGVGGGDGANGAPPVGQASHQDRRICLQAKDDGPPPAARGRAQRGGLGGSSTAAPACNLSVYKYIQKVICWIKGMIPLLQMESSNGHSWVPVWSVAEILRCNYTERTTDGANGRAEATSPSGAAAFSLLLSPPAGPATGSLSWAPWLLGHLPTGPVLP
jgi:hypothetical protein